MLMGYKKRDLPAVWMMGANIELWKCRLYEDGSPLLEPVFGDASDQARSDRRRVRTAIHNTGRCDPAAEAQAQEKYSVEKHFQRMGENGRNPAEQLRGLEVTINDECDLLRAKPLIYKAYQYIGG